MISSGDMYEPLTTMTHSIELSPELYHILQRQARDLNATIESLVESAIRRNYGQSTSTKTASLIVTGNKSSALPPGLTDELAQLTFLTDEELWQAARTKLSPTDHAHMETLLDKQQATGLEADEMAEAEMLADRYERTVLIRAKAAVLLKERGHDITSLGPTDSAP